MRATVSRYIEFDAGHRVARHGSKCANLHGHRYRLTVTVAGEILEDESAEHGMVIDFARVKAALMVLHDRWDHRFLLGVDDPHKGALSGLPGLVVLPVQPTAENLAALAMRELSDLLAPLEVVRVEMQETTSCTAAVGA